VRAARSSIALKALMALSGAAMLGYLLLHMLGNLQIFLGDEQLNTYAHWLRTLGAPVLHFEWLVWALRIGLLLAVFAHIGAAVALTKRDRAARPVRYEHRSTVPNSYAARTMRWGGVIIVLFLVYHLLDLTTGDLNPRGEHLKPYQNILADFAPERWYVALAYAVAVIAVGFHIRHGIRSAARTLGLSAGRDRAAGLLATGFAGLITAGFLVVPAAVLTGVVS
jgi:succinate dehydrogenase / fumarate reductase cytochrome b subunit